MTSPDLDPEAEVAYTPIAPVPLAIYLPGIEHVSEDIENDLSPVYYFDPNLAFQVSRLRGRDISVKDKEGENELK